MVAPQASKKTQTESPLEGAQVRKATKALLNHIHTSPAAKSEKQNLLATNVDSPQDDTAIWLSLTTKKFIVDKKRLKPARIPLAHAFTAEDATICLFVKDPQRTYKDMIEQAGLSSLVTRVVGVSKLKEKHKSFEAKRALRDAHDVFMADDRVVSLLPQLLGKTFYAGKKNPLPIEVPKNAGKIENLKIEVNKALKATHLHLAPGTCTMIKVGLAGQTGEQIAENVEMVANRVVDQFVPQKWKGVRSLHIKTSSSVALPIWRTQEVFNPETDKVAATAESQEAIENGTASGDKTKKRKSDSKKVPGIEVESIETVESERPASKKIKVDQKKTSPEVAKNAAVKPAVVAPRAAKAKTSAVKKTKKRA